MALTGKVGYPCSPLAGSVTLQPNNMADSVMAEWRVYLTGSKLSLEVLASEDGGDEWSVRRDAERIFLAHHRWKERAAGAEILPIAERLCDHINLIMSFLRTETPPHWEPVSIAAVQFVNDSGEVTHHIVWADNLSPTEWWRTVEKSTVTEEPPSVRLLVRALDGNPDLVNAIRLFKHHSDNWTQLNIMLELAKRAHGGNLPSDWASKTSIERLKYTSNFLETAGETARHVVGPGGKPPEDPMGLPQAQAIIGAIILKWLYRLAR